MAKKPADNQAIVTDPQVVALERRKQAAERAYEDAMEDDEVYEALKSLHSKKQGSAKEPGPG